MCCSHLSVGSRRLFKRIFFTLCYNFGSMHLQNLRNPSVCVLLIQLKLIKPILNSPIRWHSTHDMLHCLLLLKDFCFDMAASNQNMHLPATTWNEFSKLAAVLEPAKIAIKLLQYEKLTFDNFFGIWLNCKLKIAKLTPTSFLLAQLL